MTQAFRGHRRGSKLEGRLEGSRRVLLEIWGLWDSGDSVLNQCFGVPLSPSLGCL